MKLIYFTALKYPSKKTEPFFHRQMATAFSKVLGEKFSFIVRSDPPADLLSVRPVSIHAPRRGKALWYFLVFPYLVFSCGWNAGNTVLYSYDPYLLIAIIFWRNLFRFRYAVAVEWHQLHEDWRDAYLARHSDYNIVVSKHLKQSLKELFNTPEKLIVVAYGGVDMKPIAEVAAIERKHLRSMLGLTEGFLVGHVGVFTVAGLTKGIDILLESLLYLPGDVRLICVGGSPSDIETYEALARRLGVLDRVLLVRHQPFERVIAYERALDILIIPVSLQGAFLRTGGLPMKVWEYMAAGRPIVYTNLELLKEALEGRGRVFAPDDPRDLARVIIDMRSQWEKEENLAEQNPLAALSYTWDSRARNILNFINK